MANSNSEAPDDPETETAAGASDDAHAQAERAAERLKGQIAALRARVKTAQDHLRRGPSRGPREPRSFED